jgi:dTDP-L-rhamnose 4-epimerase
LGERGRPVELASSALTWRTNCSPEAAGLRLLDNLTEQVHGPCGRMPDHLSPYAELIAGDVRDADAVTRSLGGVDSVVNLAARVGVGQSMYELGQ